MPRERSLNYSTEVAGAAESNAEDNESLGQFLRHHCFNLRRQCANPKCGKSVLCHEQVFSHHGGRLSIKVHQLTAEHAMPSEDIYAWTVCRKCPAAKAGTRLRLSAPTLDLSLGRFLESNFYNTVATTRRPGCPHSLHLHHERYFGCGSLVCSVRFQQCVVFGITPPLPPRLLPAPAHVPALIVANDVQLSPASAAAAHALSHANTLNEVARGVLAIAADKADADSDTLGRAAVGAAAAASGGDAASTASAGDLGSHELLCEMMRWGDALPKVEVRYEEADVGASLPHGAVPVRTTILFPASFAALRERFCEGGDAAFVASLRQAVPWYTGRGGRSGSTFLKTLDGRYILKQVKEREFWDFHAHAPTYFSFVSKTPTTLPSALVKVLGAFVVEFRTEESSKVETRHLLCQENLFYGKNVVRMCDLKGARRERKDDTNELDENETVIDENLFKFNNGYPLLLSEAAKQRLTRALWNDTLFLASINVMDYSLLVGMVQTSSGSGQGAHAGVAPGAGVTVSDGRGEEWTLMVGLIDYCRQYTWKEEAESRIKRATVIQPKQYKRRFREALHRYFMASIEKV